MADPKYSLAAIQTAAAEGNIELDEKRARDEVLRFFDRFEQCYPFAAKVLLALRPEDFRKRVQLGDPPHPGIYDEYGIDLSEELAKEHGVPRNWYLKVRLYEGLYGNNAFLVSLHVPVYDLKREGGSRPPRRK